MHYCRVISLFFLVLLTSVNSLAQENPLEPVKLDHPRDTMRTFIDSMNQYHEGIETRDRKKQRAIDRALRTLNLEEIPILVRDEEGREIAQLLKEVIDRVIVIDYSKIPEAVDTSGQSVKRWRLKGTEIEIAREESGDRAGQYLFTKDTVARTREFFGKVKHLNYLPGSGMGSGFRENWMSSKLPPWALRNVVLFPNWKWIGILFCILFGLILKTLTQHLHAILKNVTQLSKWKWDDQLVLAAERPLGWIVAAVFWYFSLYLLRIEGTSLLVLTVVVQLILSAGMIWITYRLTDLLTDFLVHYTGRTSTALDDALLKMVNRTLKIFVVVFGVLVAAQNMGINVVSVMAGLGLGGLAFALAARDTFANFFGSIMIIIDRPFRIGDWINVDGNDGMVEDIGFRSTRIRTFYDSVLSIPNSVLANAKIDNYGLRSYRRVNATLGLTYDTPPGKLEAFIEGIKEILRKHPHTRKDKFHVVFSSYGDFSLNVLLYFFLKVPSWDEELIERQKIYVEIYKLAERVGVDFAFPTQTVHVQNGSHVAQPN